jgi:protein-S-isoprenylcysteine O-methyltransferase Ste14
MPIPGAASTAFSLMFVVLMLGLGYHEGRQGFVIYSLSFWHYYLYWLAYYFGAVSQGVFKRDAVLMKSVSLVLLGSVYLAAPWSFASLCVVGLGFMLNGVAARVLGADRTYYGYEVANLPPQRITAFPYSWVSHPMLVGNIAAFGGTMINSEFRRQWWPLACAHVAMNFGLLAMELAVTPQRRGAQGDEWSTLNAVATNGRRLLTCGSIALAGAALFAAAFKVLGSDRNTTLLAAGTGAGVIAYAYALYCLYSAPIYSPDKQLEKQAEELR